MQAEMIFLRHGQTEGNVRGYFVGQTESPLTELGIEQARLACGYLKDLDITAVYSSDLSRAYDTAKPIATIKGLEIKTDKRLREIHGGDWEGKNIDVLVKEYALQYGNFWLNQAEKASPPNGETIAKVKERVIEVVKEIALANPNGKVLVATHGGVIRALECIIKNAKWQDVTWVSNASATTVVYNDGEFKIKQRDFSDYLGDNKTFLPKGI